ncbi:hypothetical protein [Luteibacter yeojuensis]|uniref:Transposase n=1 Tax=Luteibacter yeojuensis TaxID=345309 RepID=A0A7X5QWR7_9GAMM|nr:hypothetical protein [Luteibacter yeojuensis]NID16722.1 hypothetical protein [Luteibacter yeojuensis]
MSYAVDAKTALPLSLVERIFQNHHGVVRHPERHRKKPQDRRAYSKKIHVEGSTLALPKREVQP